MTQAIRVVLVDDHTLVRSGFRALLQNVDGIKIVGEAENGREALKLVAQSPPDVVVTDIGMEEMNGLDLVAALKKDYPEVRSIILSMHGAPQYVSRALAAGASGYILKDAVALELELGLRAVIRGESYLSPAISRVVISGYVSGDATQSSELERLTPRQREVLQGIAEGKNVKGIAAELGVSPKTVETHRSQLMQRLNIYEVVGLVKFAIRVGLVTSDE